VHRGAQNAGIGHELLTGADAIGVGAHQREIIAPVSHAPARGELCNGRRLACSGRPDQCEYAAVHGAQLIDDGQMTQQQRKRKFRGVLEPGARGRHRGERRRDIRGDIHRRQLLEHTCLQRLTNTLVVPGNAGEFRLQQVAQVLELALHRGESALSILRDRDRRQIPGQRGRRSPLRHERRRGRHPCCGRRCSLGVARCAHGPGDRRRNCGRVGPGRPGPSGLSSFADGRQGRR